MKEDEKRFFRTCIKYITVFKNGDYKKGHIFPKYLIEILDEWLPHNRAYFYLRKWMRLGFYDYGVSEGTGWIILDELPQRYKELLGEDE